MTDRRVKAVINETWINKYWRPHMAYTYMVICIFDFIVGPILNYVFYLISNQAFVQWSPLTLISGGLFHMAMGAIVGASALTRGQEKIARTNNGIVSTDATAEESSKILNG